MLSVKRTSRKQMQIQSLSTGAGKRPMTLVQTSICDYIPLSILTIMILLLRFENIALSPLCVVDNVKFNEKKAKCPYNYCDFTPRCIILILSGCGRIG